MQMVTIHLHYGGSFVKGNDDKLAFEWGQVDVLPKYYMHDVEYIQLQ